MSCDLRLLPLPHPPQPVKTSDNNEKKSYVLKELFETERSFLSVLKLVSHDFFSAMCEVICAEDVELIFSTAKVRSRDLLGISCDHYYIM